MNPIIHYFELLILHSSVSEFLLSLVWLLFLTKIFCLFTSREMGSEGEREGNINVWETYQPVASHTPLTGDLTPNPGMCTDRNWASDLLVCRPARNPLSHTSQSGFGFFCCVECKFLESQPNLFTLFCWPSNARIQQSPSPIQSFAFCGFSYLLSTMV